MITKDIARLAIVRGAILLGHFDDIDHQKFFVVIGENENQLIGFFFINSNIHNSIKQKQAQLEMQMPIKKSQYPFLKYDSWIGANKITTISKDKIASDIITKSTQIKGNLTDDDLSLLLDAIRSSKLFSKIEKETFFK